MFETHDQTLGPDHGDDEADPHLWLDPENAKLWLGAIAIALAGADPSYVPPAITAAGIFTLFASIYAGYVLYHLLSPLAAFLLLAGVAATAIRYDGMIHGFFGMSAVLDKGVQAVAQASSALMAAFAAQKETAAR